MAKMKYLEIGFDTQKDKWDFQDYCRGKIDTIELKGGVLTPRVLIRILELGIVVVSQIITEYLKKNPDKEIIIAGKKINSVWVSRTGVLVAFLSELSS